MATIDRRVNQRGGVRWRARIRRRGVIETASFDSREEAAAWADEVEAAIDRGEWRVPGRTGNARFGQLLDRYLAWRRPGRDTRRQLEWWRRRCGDEALTDLSRRSILGLRRRLVDEPTSRGRRRSPATANRYVAALSGFLSWAIRRGHLGRHPLRGVDSLPEGPARTRCLSEEERERLLAACREHGDARLHALVVLSLSCGASRGELLRLRWSDLDLTDRRVTIPGVGGRHSRTLPLFGPAIPPLRQLSRVRRIDSDQIFVDSRGRPSFPRAAWRAVLAAADIENFRFHDLRHSTAAYLVMSGASLSEVARVLGYRSVRAVRRYSGLVDRRAATAIRRVPTGSS